MSFVLHLTIYFVQIKPVLFKQMHWTVNCCFPLLLSLAIMFTIVRACVVEDLPSSKSGNNAANDLLALMASENKRSLTTATASTVAMDTG
jgi:hypothetical protein